MGNPLSALKDKAKILDVIGNIKNSPFCQFHLNEITRYQKSTVSERWVLDKSAAEHQEIMPK